MYYVCTRWASSFFFFFFCPLLLPVILPVGSPWPLLLCSRKKSLLLSVTHSFRAFFSRTSSGFSHIIVGPAGGGTGGVSPSQLPRRWESWYYGRASSCQTAGSSGSGAARSVLQRRHVDPALPTAAGLRAHRHTLPRPVRPSAPSRPICSSCTHRPKIL